MLQSVAWIGIYGLSFLTVLAASLPALLGTPSLIAGVAGPALRAGDCRRLADPCAGLAGAIRLAAMPTADDRHLAAPRAAVDPADAEMGPGRRANGISASCSISAAAPATHPLAAVLWPEAATPFLLERDAYHRREIAAVAAGRGYVITGALRANPPPGPVAQVWNSIEAVDGNGDIVARYDKAHLVPFGEYVPFREILPLKKITPGSLDYHRRARAADDRAAGAAALRPADLLRGHFPGRGRRRTRPPGLDSECHQ